MSPRSGICLGLLILNVLYCAAASFGDSLPAWPMFKRVEPLDYSLKDRSGAAIDIHDYLMRSEYVNTAPQLAAIASFICRLRPGSAPYTLENRNLGTRVILTVPSCHVPLAH